MKDTIFLNPTTWDLDIDAAGNIALANAPYATAQNVASALRLWRGEAPFDTDRGMPYDGEILGKQVPRQTLAQWMQTEAESVADVTKATVVLQYGDRVESGQVQLTLSDGSTTNG